MMPKPLRVGSRQTIPMYFLVILLLGWGLRLYALNDRWLDRDEAYIYSHILSEPLSDWIVTEYDIGSHMLTQILSKFAMSLYGDSLFSLRWFEATLGFLALPLLYRLATWSLGQRVGVLATGLLAISPYAIYYAHTFRAYSSMTFYVLLTYYCTLRALQTGQRRYTFGAILALALAVYNHQYSALAAAGVMALVFAQPHVSWRSLLFGLITAIGGPLIALMPILIRVGLGWGRNSEITAFSKNSQGLIAVEIPDVPASFWTVLAWFSGIQLEWKEVNPAPYLVYGLGGLIILGLMLNPRGARLWLTWWAAPLLIYTLANAVMPTLWARPKHFGYTLPFFLTLIALALIELQRYFPRPFKLMPYGILCLIISSWLLTLTELQAREIKPWSHLATYLHSQITPTDLIICQSYQQDWRSKDNICLRNLSYGLHQKNNYPVISLGEAVAYGPQWGSQPNRVWLVVTDLPPDHSAQFIWRTPQTTIMVLPPPPQLTVSAAMEQHLSTLSQLPQAGKLRLDEIDHP